VITKGLANLFGSAIDDLLFVWLEYQRYDSGVRKYSIDSCAEVKQKKHVNPKEVSNL